ncbi:toll/interleukin-1 receptor domain-containing protein [Thermogemmatispora sp.]|uniref:toll/interleukin-1 receptor domain-containing protein n=1 Tax=Thermogemmatispora sp. TaxID=1968838 RepID=UPI001D69C2DE|nr:toll/interleukin-1 receptor domain-containing protein [Thermogemmatispora sp.]MBX5451466.1 toll/interleukin-1 receptor domain-containing protein [Thermogemmatispora sp.]
MRTSDMITVFCSWSGTATDGPWSEQVLTMLKPLAAQNLIALWEGGPPATETAAAQERAQALARSALFLVLLSPDYLAAPERVAELEQVWRRHAGGELVLIPVVLRACAWRESAVGDLTPLPVDGQALASRDDPEEGLRQVERGLRCALGSLLFARLRQRDASAAELLRFCSCLAPAPIPESLLTEGLARPSHPLAALAADHSALMVTLAALEADGLLTRDPQSGNLQVHELVREALTEHLPAEELTAWQPLAIEALVTAYPGQQPEHWPLYEALLPHALHCAAWIAREPALQTAPAASLLEQAGTYLRQHGRYQEAVPLFERALSIREQVLGPEHAETATSLYDLAFVYRFAGRSSEALPLLERALSIREQALGPAHPLTVTTLESLAFLHMSTGRLTTAFPLLERLAPLAEQVFGPSNPKTLSALNTLALCYERLDRLPEACTLFERALALCEQAHQSPPSLMATLLHNLALLYRRLGHTTESLALLERALAVCEQTFGPSDRRAATTLYNLALLYRDLGRREEALPLLERALGRREEALPLLERALAIYERAAGSNHPLTRQVRETYRQFQPAED